MKSGQAVLYFCALTAALSGCPSPSLYTTPRTIPTGTFQHTIAAEGIGVIGSSTAVLPTLPTYQLRIGVHDQLDIGVRVANMTGLGADVKWNFLRTPGFDLAIDPGFQLYLWGASSRSTSSSGSISPSTDSFIIGYAHLPLLIGFNFNEAITLLLTPGFSWGFGSVSSSGGTTGFASGPLVRLGVGANFRLTQNFALQPEVTFLKPFDNFSDSGVFMTFGLGFQFGSMPNHSDLAYR